jgi:SAM-dependent methyltransferase
LSNRRPTTPSAIADLHEPSRIGAAIRAGQIPADRAFDYFLPHRLRAASAQHWTPLRVAARAAQWLAEVGVRSVLDVGSGAGKFCVAAALAGSTATFVGIEQRSRLIDSARALAHVFGVGDRVSFVNARLGEGPLPVADAYYLYNPFGENVLSPEDHLDADVELSDDRYLSDIALFEGMLERTAVGTYLITYNGFGGHVPAGFREVRIDSPAGCSVLRMWCKTGNGPDRLSTPLTSA